MQPFFFYPPNQSRLAQKPDKDGKVGWGGKATPYEDQPALEYWEKHYFNCLVLRAMLAETQDPASRQLLSSELEVGEDKMAHWQRHPNWKVEDATRIAMRLKDENPILAKFVGLTIANRWRVERKIDFELEIAISEFTSTEGVTRLEGKGKARPKKGARRR